MLHQSAVNNLHMQCEIVFESIFLLDQLEFSIFCRNLINHLTGSDILKMHCNLACIQF